MPMAEDAYAPLCEPYALGALNESERAAFEAHLSEGCETCQKVVAQQRGVVQALAQGMTIAPPAPSVRQQLLDLAQAPSMPVDLAAFEWQEVVPGVRVHVMKDDPSRGMRACLVWAQPGARHPRHRHLGDELILVLQGAIGDERGRYGPGEICRSREGSVHSEEALPGEDCVCYVLYYGGLEMLEAPASRGSHSPRSVG